jgi:hypothetical protein
MTNAEGMTKLENADTDALLRHLGIILLFDIRASSFSSFVVND